MQRYADTQMTREPNADARGVRARHVAAYDGLHAEIFNTREQERIAEALAKSSAAVRSRQKDALDFGAGSGNLTRHMIDLGYTVTAADVSPDFLRVVKDRFRVQTIELVGGFLSYLPDASFDLIGVYSVMHHIPDYLAAATDLVRKLRPGGVLLIDHECNSNYWCPPPTLAAFRRENANARTGAFWDPEHKPWQHILRATVVPSRHLARLRYRRRISAEGDIHVYPDDHIEWDRLLTALEAAGADLIERMDYLLFSASYDEAVWERYRHRCDDYTGVIVRRRDGGAHAAGLGGRSSARAAAP